MTSFEWAVKRDGTPRTTRCRECGDEIALTTDDILESGKIKFYARTCAECADRLDMTSESIEDTTSDELLALDAEAFGV
jgi:uncharacterized protein YlaI